MHLGLSPLDLLVFAAYFVAVAGVSIWASRRSVKTKRDYFLGGDRLPWWMIGGSIVAANISSHQLVGVMGVAYQRGFSAVSIEWPTILLGFNALLWIFLPFYLRNGFYTMPEFLQRRFGGAARGLFAALTVATYLFVEISAVLYLGALALHTLLGWSMSTSMLALAVATGLYTIGGGLRAVVWTEMLQLVVLLLGGMALSVAVLHRAGGWPSLLATSSDWHMLLPADDPDFPWTMYLGGLPCISIFYCAANQFIVQRVLAARNEWHARTGVVFADYLKFALPLIIIVPGILGARLFPHLAKPDMIFPTLVANVLPHGLVGLVLAGLVAAVMSHLAGAVNSTTTILTLDFFMLWRREADDAQAVRFGRWAGALVLVVGIGGALLLMRHSQKPIFLYLLNAYGYFTPGIAVMFLGGILWRRTTSAGALSAGLLTIPLTLLLEFFVPTMPFFNRTGIVFWTCAVICIVVSLLTKPPAPEALAGLIWTPASMRLPAAERRGWLRSPALWWALLTGLVLYFYVRYR
jgi:solute:Na+ symporter, SSS family